MSDYDAPGGGGGSSYGPAGSTFAPAASVATPASVTISWTASAPSARITTPADGATYAEGQVLDSSFTCTEGAGGPGISSCLDQDGKPTGDPVATSTPGLHTFTVTATSSDGLTEPASVTYTVSPAVSPAPKNEVAPAISGTPKAGQTLSCSTGTWANLPTSYAYQWDRDGTALLGATSSSYAVVALDEGTTLTCTVTAKNLVGSSSATSAGVFVPVPVVARCPAAGGELTGARLGSIKLGMSRAQARRAYSHSSDRGRAYEDFFCLTPIGIRVGYASPKLLDTLSKAQQATSAGRVIWASTANPRYAVDGVRPGATLAAAAKRLKVGKVLPIGLNDWYLAPAGSVTAVLKVRGGAVEEIGIAVRALTRTRVQQHVFMTSFE